MPMVGDAQAMKWAMAYMGGKKPEMVLIMKYYNKTRTIEQKVTDREILDHLKNQTLA